MTESSFDDCLAWIEAMPIGVAIVDIACTILATNSAFEGVVGPTAEKSVGRDLARIFDSSRMAASVRCAIENAGKERIDSVASDRSAALRVDAENEQGGGDRSFEVSVLPLEVGSGIAAAVSFVECSGRVRDAQTIASLRGVVDRLGTEIEELTYVVSHDLSEPLRKVTSFSRLLERHLGDGLDDKGRELLGYVVDSAARMKCQLDDLLELSRVGRDDAEPVAVSLLDCLDRIRRRLADSIERSGVAIEAADLPTLDGHPATLTQLLEQLIANAVKFHQGESPVVRVSAARDERIGAWRIEVADNGLGIEEKHRERVFEVFQRLHARDAYEGTGIGLALCKRIVEQRGGRIWIEDGALGGTTVCATLPDLARPND